MDESKNPAAVELGRKGGLARVKNQTKKERKESAKAAANARWDEYRRQHPPEKKKSN